jgi:hypothetical protein
MYDGFVLVCFVHEDGEREQNRDHEGDDAIDGVPKGHHVQLASFAPAIGDVQRHHQHLRPTQRQTHYHQDFQQDVRPEPAVVRVAVQSQNVERHHQQQYRKYYCYYYQKYVHYLL